MTTDIDALLRQHAELKRRDPEAILLFRVKTENDDGCVAFGIDARSLCSLTSMAILHASPRDPSRDQAEIYLGNIHHVFARIVSAGRSVVVIDPASPGAAMGDDATRAWKAFKAWDGNLRLT